MKIKLFLAILVFNLTIEAQDVNLFRIFENPGNETDYIKMLGTILQADVVLFGELHNNQISHWFELNLLRDIHKNKKENLIFGAEMFETDDQIKIDEFFANQYSENIFEQECKLWNNYKKDYKPLVSYAKQNKIKFVATNIPRRYANMVMRNDFTALDKLSKEIKKLMAPLPIKYNPNLSCYKSIVEQTPQMGHDADPQKIAKSQALKDATMAYFIFTNWKKGKVFFHVNGSYHSDNYCGIYTFLKIYKSDIKIVTITTVEQQDLSSPLPENAQLADFIIVVNSEFYKSY